jgi:hypothetical protein
VSSAWTMQLTCGSIESLAKEQTYCQLIKYETKFMLFSNSIHFATLKMFLKTWEDFEKGAERLYLQDPDKVSYSYG